MTVIHIEIELDPCDPCAGTGQCVTCDGIGRIDGDDTCPDCEGTGTCPDCQGSRLNPGTDRPAAQLQPPSIPVPPD